MNKRHIADDAAARRLRAAGNPEAMDKILQEECRRRASRKLAATLLCGDFRFPTALSAEQCTSDEVAEFHASLLPPGLRILDMTAGLGIDAFHLARTAASVTAIDIDPTVASALGHNAPALGLDNVEAICADSTQWLADNPGRGFDAIFIDPARRGEGGRRLYGLADCKPDVTALLPEISHHTSRLIVKASPMLDITHLLRDEGLMPAQILAIGTRSECKELVLDFRFDSPPAPPTVRAITIGHPEFSFTCGSPAPQPQFTEPEAGMLVGDPWPAVMKSGGLGHLPGKKMHPLTHLWLLTPDEARTFPGDVYTLTAITPFSSSVIKQIARTGIDASVAVRNFPLKADELRRRLNARESDTTRLIGVTTLSARVLLTLTQEQVHPAKGEEAR